MPRCVSGAPAGIWQRKMRENGFEPNEGGRRLSEWLIDAACKAAKMQGFSTICLMSGEIGLYEKYGFQKMGEYETIYHTTDQLFSRAL